MEIHFHNAESWKFTALFKGLKLKIGWAIKKMVFWFSDEGLPTRMKVKELHVHRAISVYTYI